jgi:hypothetical protein
MLLLTYPFNVAVSPPTYYKIYKKYEYCCVILYIYAEFYLKTCGSILSRDTI